MFTNNFSEAVSVKYNSFKSFPLIRQLKLTVSLSESVSYLSAFSAGNSVDHPVFSFSTKWNSTLTHSKLNRKENPTSICTITPQNFSFLMTRLALIMCAILCELKQKFQLRTELHTTDRHAALKYVLYYKSRTFSLCAGSN